MLTNSTPLPATEQAGSATLREILAVERSYPTLRQQALAKLRRAIVDGQLPPGTRLVERKLCELLGVSRSIVRETLGQLEAEGWSEKVPYKGRRVAVIDEDGIREIFEMRAAIEGRVAALCAKRATSAQIEQLEETVEAMEAAQRSADVDAQIRTIEMFYEILLQGAGNSLMASYLASQRNRLARLRRLSLSNGPRAEISVAEKRRIVAAIRERNADAAQVLAEEHVWNSSESLRLAVHKTETPRPAAW